MVLDSLLTGYQQTADYESDINDEQGNPIFADGEYRDGYLCPDCSALPCDRCDEMIPLDEDICPYDLYGIEDDQRSTETTSQTALTEFMLNA